MLVNRRVIADLLTLSNLRSWERSCITIRTGRQLQPQVSRVLYKGMATAKETCKSGVPKSCLDHVVSDIHIAQLAKSVTEWQELAPFLDLSPAEEKEIVEQYSGRLKLQTREALRKWKEKNGRKATYQNLTKIFREQEKADLAEIVESLLSTLSENKTTGTGSSGISNSNNIIIDAFHDYLHDCYSELSHPSFLQWPNLSSECYVELGLLDVPVKAEVDNSNLVKPIPLKFLLSAGNSKAKRKVVLVEGVAGVGKTTLSWHACKEWATGRLFEDIKLLVHVSLNDRVFHSASKLTDLIPHPSEEMRTSVAKAIADKRGKGICFLLEGCDEAPPSLWQSFLYRFVAGTGGRSMLPDAHIILTSRPGIPIQVANCLTGKVVIKGFSLLEYIHALHLEKEKQLLEVLEMRPELYSLCHLPLNAVILVYLHKFSDTLPSTRTSLFDLFVQHFLLRHMQTRTTAYCEISSIDNFPNGLPSEIFYLFTAISKLAYQSILELQNVIDQTLLGKFGFSSVDNAFGFLQVHQKPTMRGIHKQYTFIHLSLEEYLAAFHITQMDRHKQIEAVKKIFDQNPLSPVLTFYAGLSGLKIDEVRDLLLKVLSESIGIEDIVKKLGLKFNDPDSMHEVNPASDPRRHMLALMNCMYETQNPTLFTHVKLPMPDPQFADLEINMQNVYIILMGMLLYPTDCLSIGSFIRNIISQTHNIAYHIDLSSCLLGDMEIKALAIDLRKPVVPVPLEDKALAAIKFEDTYISAGAINCIATLISTDSCITGVDVDIGMMESNTLFFKYCIEGFVNSKYSLWLKFISLQSICCNPNFMHYLVLLLRCHNLYGLNLSSGNQLLFASPSAMPLFCEALKYSCLACLNLSECGIDDNLLKSLTSIVCHQSCAIQILDLFRNHYSEHGLTYFLERLLNSPLVRLHQLSVNHVSEDHNKQLKSINNIRKRFNQPILKINQVDRNKRTEENVKALAMLDYYTQMRPDLALQSLHH